MEGRLRESRLKDNLGHRARCLIACPPAKLQIGIGSHSNENGQRATTMAGFPRTACDRRRRTRRDHGAVRAARARRLSVRGALIRVRLTAEMPVTSSCRWRLTCTATPESAYRMPAHRADCRAAAPISCARPRAVCPRADARHGFSPGRRVRHGLTAPGWRVRRAPRSGPARIAWQVPSGFGESTALERSSVRNSPGRYSSATDMPLHATSVAPRMAAKTLFRPMRRPPEIPEKKPTPHLGSAAGNSSRYWPARLPGRFPFSGNNSRASGPKTGSAR